MFYGAVIRLFNNVNDWKLINTYNENNIIIYEFIIAAGRNADGEIITESTFVPASIYEKIKSGEYSVFIDLDFPGKMKLFNKDSKFIPFTYSNEEDKLIRTLK